MVILRNLIIVSSLTLVGCTGTNTSNQPVTAMKPEITQSQEEIGQLLVGKWLGDQPTKEGGSRKWLVERRPDGKYLIQFRVTNSDGSILEQTEVGEWGVSGNIYFSIFKGWIDNGNFIPSDSSDSYNQDAYEIIKLTEQQFRYKNLDSGNEYTVKRVPNDFVFPTNI